MVANLKSLYIPIDPLPKVDTSWLGGLENALGDAIDKAGQNKSFGKLADQIAGSSQPGQPATSGFLSNLSGQPAANVPAPTQGTVAVGTPNQIEGDFISTVRNGGLTNPYGLAAVAATGRAESGWSPKNVNAAWPDPSQGGQAGTAGGILSWRNERLANLRNYAQAQGEDPASITPATQAKFFLQEDPTLITRLNQAKSPQEAAGIMANAWKFAGYNQAGGEAARRAALTQNYYAQQFANAQQQAAPSGPTQVASLDPSAGLPMPGATAQMQASSPAPAATAPFDPATATPDQLRQALGGQTQAPYVDPQVTTAGRLPTGMQQPSAPAQVAQTEQAPSPSVIAGAQPVTRQTITNEQIANLVRDPNTRQVGLQLWQQVLGKAGAQPWQFIQLGDGTLARANQATGEVQSIGQFNKPKASLQNVPKGGSLYDESTGQWIAPPEGAGSNDNEFFGTTIPYYDQKGNLRYRQLAKNGHSQDVDLGPGATAAPNTKTVDDGVNIHVQGPGGQDIAVIPKQNAQEAREKASGSAEGKAQGEAIAALPGTEGFAKSLQGDIENLKADKYLPKMLGWNHYLPNFSPDAARVQGKLDQLQGGSFLAARNWLKGQGPITDFESGRAERAYARLSTAQNEQDFKDALDDFYSAVQQGVDVVARVAGKSPAAGNQTTTGVKWSIEK